MRRRSAPRPTEAQTITLRRIAQGGGLMMLTLDPERGNRFHDSRGQTIAERTARTLIRNGWVRAERDSMFDLTPQSWRVLPAFTPAPLTEPQKAPPLEYEDSAEIVAFPKAGR